MKKKSGKAFIDKIKTISISTGAKPPVCPDCGGVPIKLTPIAAVMVSNARRKPGRDESNDQSFSA
jgi:hypothetical protein